MEYTIEQNDSGLWEVGYWQNDCFHIDDETQYSHAINAQDAADKANAEYRRSRAEERMEYRMMYGY